MPNLFDYMGYKIYFWSNENNEPIHVHVSKGKPVRNSTKIWITKSGKCIVENNSSQISNSDLRKLVKAIESNRFYIMNEWKLVFSKEEILFYC